MLHGGMSMHMWVCMGPAWDHSFLSGMVKSCMHNAFNHNLRIET